MAYYNRKQVVDYSQNENKKAEERKLTPLTPIEQTMSQIEKEEDVVGFFWVNITEGEKMTMEGKTFVRIDYDLYTDDRFAIDLYQAQNEGKTVSDVIKQRASDAIKDEDSTVNKDEIEQKIKQTIKNHGY